MANVEVGLLLEGRVVGKFWSWENLSAGYWESWPWENLSDGYWESWSWENSLARYWESCSSENLSDGYWEQLMGFFVCVGVMVGGLRSPFMQALLTCPPYAPLQHAEWLL